MIRVELSFDNLPLTVVFYNDGGANAILCDGVYVEHHFADEAAREIYRRAWEDYADPANQYDQEKE